MKLYKIIDGDHAFHDGECFKSIDDARENLASYHSIDWEAERDIYSLTIEELLEHGQWEIEEVEGIICPLCGVGIEPKQKNESHFWSCTTCPFIGFEYYGDDNITDLINFIE